MSYTRIQSTVLSLFLGLVAVGCSSKPDEQMGLAQKALDEAKEQRAEQFAATEWRSAQQSWELAKAALDKERYGEAGTQFLTAKSRYEKARNVAKSKRDAVLREIKGLQTTIDIRYKSLKASIDASGDKLSAKLRKSLEDSCRDIDKGVDKAKAEVEQGEYATALTTAQEAMRQVYAAEKEIEAAAKRKSS